VEVEVMRRTLALGIKEYLLWVAVLTLALTPVVSVRANSEVKYHAGYFYFSYSGNAPWGVWAHIYTINPSVPFNTRFSEWDAIVLRYNPEYWLQTGFREKNIGWEYRHFYIEKKDESGHLIWAVDGTPQAGHTYSYLIVNAFESDPHWWRVKIREGSQIKYQQRVWVDPYIPRDLQAFVEVTGTTKICITGSHFSSLKCFAGWFWPYWDRHVKWSTPGGPYWVDDKGHYEFYAYGGG